MKRINSETEIDINFKFLEYCKLNQFDKAIKLLPKVTDINVQRSLSDYTPLLHAIAYENYKAAKVFIEKGADVNKIAGYTADYKTCALDLLARREFNDELGKLIELIIQKGGKLDLVVRGFDIVTIIIIEGNDRLIDFLFNNGYIIDQQPTIVSGNSVTKLKQIVKDCLDNEVDEEEDFSGFVEFTDEYANQTNEENEEEDFLELANVIDEYTNQIIEMMRQIGNNTDQAPGKDGENPECFLIGEDVLQENPNDN